MSAKRKASKDSHGTRGGEVCNLVVQSGPFLSAMVPTSQYGSKEPIPIISKESIGMYSKTFIKLK